MTLTTCPNPALLLLLSAYAGIRAQEVKDKTVTGGIFPQNV